MATKSKNIDLGGNTIICAGIRIADKPHQAGTELGGAELEVLDGVTAGTATASKAVVLGASKEIATLGAVTAAAITGTVVTGSTSLVTGTLTIPAKVGAATAAGTGGTSAGAAGGAAANVVFTVVQNGTTYYIPGFTSNA